MLTSNIMEVTLHVHVAVSVDIKMAKLNSRHADKMVCSCPRYCLFSSPEFILLLPNKVMPWGGGAYNHASFSPLLQNIPLIADSKKANRFFAMYLQIPPENSFL